MTQVIIPLVPTQAIWLLAGVEIGLGLWLASGAFFRIVNCLVFALFLVFAFFNAYLIYSGVRSCHCFGEILTSPSLMLALDLVCATIAAICILSDLLPLHKTPILAVAGTCSILAGVCLTIIAIFFSSSIEVSGWDDTETVEVVSGGVFSWKIQLDNKGKAAQKILDVTTSCACLGVTIDQPVILPGCSVNCTAILDLSKNPEYSGELELLATFHMLDLRQSMTIRRIVKVTNSPSSMQE